VKKFTILRDFNRNGIDTKQFYNPDVDILKIEEENLKFNRLEISDIFNKIREKVAVVEDTNISKTNVKAKKIGEDLDALMLSLKAGQEIGYPLEGDLFNFVSKGARLGKMYMYSAPTGHGKTRFLVGNACALSLPYIDGNEIVIRENLNKIVFIATEMDPDEIQTLVLAWVSGSGRR
jgi:replicative DNA helicase